ncbi:hypothetical protein NL676_007266 [Syzygium grande]|nr:hypothetical protein NL676_007266 [Syzygium grande]
MEETIGTPFPDPSHVSEAEPSPLEQNLQAVVGPKPNNPAAIPKGKSSLVINANRSSDLGLNDTLYVSTLSVGTTTLQTFKPLRPPAWNAPPAVFWVTLLAH